MSKGTLDLCFREQLRWCRDRRGWVVTDVQRPTGKITERYAFFQPIYTLLDSISTMNIGLPGGPLVPGRQLRQYIEAGSHEPFARIQLTENSYVLINLVCVAGQLYYYCLVLQNGHIFRRDYEPLTTAQATEVASWLAVVISQFEYPPVTLEVPAPCTYLADDPEVIPTIPERTRIIEV